jgi:hypothetical protein
VLHRLCADEPDAEQHRVPELQPTTPPTSCAARLAPHEVVIRRTCYVTARAPFPQDLGARRFLALPSARALDENGKIRGRFIAG